MGHFLFSILFPSAYVVTKRGGANSQVPKGGQRCDNEDVSVLEFHARWPLSGLMNSS